MRLFRYVLLLCCLFTGSMSYAQTPGASLDDRGYGIYVPSSYDEDGEDMLPLLIALHGFGDTWQNFHGATGLLGMAAANDFIVVFPQGFLGQWNDGSVGDHYEDDVQLLRDLVAQIERDYRVDPKRIYLAGFSNGATMTFKAACEAPDLFAGIAAIGGTMRTAQSFNCDNAQLPVLMIHGTADNVISFTGDPYRYAVPDGMLFWAEQNECNLDAVPPYTPARFQNGIATYLYIDCPSGNYVMLHALQGIGHIWPGATEYYRDSLPESQYDTAAIIWIFFQATHNARLEAQANAESTQSADD